MLKESTEITHNILSYFDDARFEPLKLNINALWRLPDKKPGEYRHRIQFSDRINHYMDKYNISYLGDIFDKIDKAIYKGIPFKVLKDGDGFVYPERAYHNKLLYINQLKNRKSCDDFAEMVCRFEEFPCNGSDGVSIYYLLGYVGSGKSTFIDYIINTKKEQLSSERVIYAVFKYNEVSKKIYDDNRSADDWQREIREIIFNKIINAATSLQEMPFKKLFDKNTTENVIDIALNFNILLCLDGFDSLSPNIIEKRNANFIILAIENTIDELKDIYSKRYIIERGLKVVYCLRKCSYEALVLNKKLRGADSEYTYFLFAPNFEDLIKNVIKIMAKVDNGFIAKYENQLSEIIVETSIKANKLLACVDDSLYDVFDNNYRRKLRYISTVIIIHALRLSSIFSKTASTDDIHKDFFEQLKMSIVGDKRNYLFVDILIYGLNSGYNNHFSNTTTYDNLGKYCGFVDNIFWYFQDKDSRITFKEQMLLKLRVLQILGNNVDDKECNYMSKQEILDSLQYYGYKVSGELLAYFLDFLEKSLFVRSSMQSDNKDIHFKCSNFGKLLLNKILCDYCYIAAVSQNTCVPKEMALLIKYKEKILSEPGSKFFIEKNWIKSIIPYIIYFIRLIKTVELSNEKAQPLYIHKIIIENSKRIIERILNSDTCKLDVKEIEELDKKCLAALEYVK